MKRYLLALILLSACNNGLPVNPDNPIPSMAPDPTASNTPGQSDDSLFANALQKRSLPLDLFKQNQADGASEDAAVSQPAGAPISAPQAGNAVSAPSIAPGAPVAEGGVGADERMAASLIFPGHGGHEFNHYVLQHVEESLFPASSDATLLQAWNNTAKALADQWDAQARLVESHASAGSPNKDHFQFLPGPDGQAVRMQVNYRFRLVSNTRKESLLIYFTEQNTHVQRMIWGQVDIPLDSLKIDSDAAMQTARRAFADRSDDQDYPIYPQHRNPRMMIVYDIPSDAHWSLNLNQHSGRNSRYFVSLDFQVGNQRQHAYGSAEIDAVTGKILNLNRPVYYQHRDFPEPIPVEPDGGIGDGGVEVEPDLPDAAPESSV